MLDSNENAGSANPVGYRLPSGNRVGICLPRGKQTAHVISLNGERDESIHSVAWTGTISDSNT